MGIEFLFGVIKYPRGTSLAIQWLGVSTFAAMAPGSIPGQVTKIPQATQSSQKKKKRKKENVLELEVMVAQLCNYTKHQ